VPDLRTWVAAVVIGACLGASIGTVLFGSPPARIPLESSADGSCPDLDASDQRWLLVRLEDAARPAIDDRWYTLADSSRAPSWSIGLAPCADALEVWGAPLLPARRSDWLEAVDGITAHQTLLRFRQTVDQDILAARESLEDAMTRAVEGLNGLDDDQVIAALSEEEQLLGDVLDARSALTTLEQRARFLELIPAEPELMPPGTGLMAIALGGLLGGLGGIVFAGLVGHRRGPPVSSSS
jgi:hypothetical protein